MNRPQEEWDEATARVLAYFAAIRLGGVQHRTRTALKVIEEAARRVAQRPDLPPVEAAMTVANEWLSRWFARALPESPGDPIAVGLVALRVSEAEAHWPNALLSADPPPPLKEALESVSVRTGPDLFLSSMAPREMDYGAMETLANETWHQFSWGPLLRAAALWTAIFFLALFTYDRFFPQ